VMPHKLLPAEISVGVHGGRWQFQRVVRNCLMFSRTANLHDFAVGRTFQYPMADVRWLQDGVPSFQPERRTLILIDHVHPSPVAEDHLKSNVVMMDVVRYRSAVGDGDVRGDEPATQTVGDEVAIHHARPADLGVACRRGEDKARSQIRHRNVVMNLLERQSQAVGSINGPGFVAAFDADASAAGAGRGAFKPQCYAMGRKDCGSGVIGREDLIDPKPVQCQELNGLVEAGRRQNQLAVRLRR